MDIRTCVKHCGCDVAACVVKDEEDVYGEEARGEDDMDDDDDEGQEAEVEATLRANVSYSLTSKPINCKKVAHAQLPSVGSRS